MDVLTVEAALDLAGKVAEHVDIIELGTPLVKNAGLGAVTAVKTAHPDKIVFADMKTMDAGELEAEIAFAAGADLVSVLGSADDSTIAGAVKAAKAHNKGIVVDLIGVQDKVARAKEARALGAKFIEFHAGLFACVPFSVAGGVNLSTIEAVQRAGADVAVVGGSIYSADDPAVAAKELRAAII